MLQSFDLVLAAVLIIGTSIIFMLTGCATASIGVADKSAGIQAPADNVVTKTYPYIAPSSPELVAGVDLIISAAKKDGYMFLGMAADIHDNTMLWFQKPDGECVAFMILFGQQRMGMVKSCEAGLEGWKECVAEGVCKE